MRPTFTVRNDVDFIALAPVVLGFVPTHSLVMMTLDKFHARIDVPDEEHVNEVVEMLVAPAEKHGVGRVALIIFDEGHHPALMAKLISRFDRAHIEVLAAVQVGEGKYRTFGRDWEPLDLSMHPLTLEAHYEGVAPLHRSRNELVEYVKPCGAPAPYGSEEAVDQLRQDGPAGCITVLTTTEARQNTELWTGVLRSLEPGSELVPHVAIVLGFAAWLSGDGALAWVALDQADPENELCQLLATVLQKAVNPASWDEMKNRG